MLPSLSPLAHNTGLCQEGILHERCHRGEVNHLFPKHLPVKQFMCAMEAKSFQIPLNKVSLRPCLSVSASRPIPGHSLSFRFPRVLMAVQILFLLAADAALGKVATPAEPLKVACIS